jgi:hypothetical protein
MVEYYKENLNLTIEELALNNQWLADNNKSIYDIDNLQDFIAFR